MLAQGRAGEMPPQRCHQEFFMSWHVWLCSIQAGHGAGGKDTNKVPLAAVFLVPFSGKCLQECAPLKGGECLRGFPPIKGRAGFSFRDNSLQRSSDMQTG